MMSSVMPDTREPEAAPAAILDVDGPLYQESAPLGVGFTAYLFEESAGRTLGREVNVSFDPANDYFSTDEWDALRDGLQGYGPESSAFDAESLEAMYDEWAAYRGGAQNYATAARAITKHWVDGITGMQQDEVERTAEAYIDEIEPSIPRPVNNVIGELRGRGYDVYLASLNPQEVLEPFAELVYGGAFGRENVYGTVVGTDETGRYEERLDRNMLQADGKGAVVEDISGRSELNGRSLAMGDTPADMPLFRAVGNVALVNPVDGFTAADVEEALAEAAEDEAPHVFNIKDVGGIARRLLRGEHRERQVVAVESIEEFLTLLASDAEWTAALS